MPGNALVSKVKSEDTNFVDGMNLLGLVKMGVDCKDLQKDCTG